MQSFFKTRNGLNWYTPVHYVAGIVIQTFLKLPKASPVFLGSLALLLRDSGCSSVAVGHVHTHPPQSLLVAGKQFTHLHRPASSSSASLNSAPPEAEGRGGSELYILLA